MAFRYQILTRYSETGQDGIIHHSSYVVYLEVARLEFFKKIGLDINDLEKRGILCPVVDLSIKYKKPLHSLEDIEVKIYDVLFSKVRFTLLYQILRKEDCVSQASVSHCLVEKNKPIPIPKHIIQEFKRFRDNGS